MTSAAMCLNLEKGTLTLYLRYFSLTALLESKIEFQALIQAIVSHSYEEEGLEYISPVVLHLLS
jgi:hypothetical protein